MSSKKTISVDARSVDVTSEFSYPAPFDEICQGRIRRTLGDLFELTDFGVNAVTLKPGAWSAQRHWHSHEDEFIYVLEGALTLVTDEGKHELAAGTCAGFRAGDENGHHLRNEGFEDAVYLEIGTRNSDDSCHYPDIDLHLEPNSQGGRFLHKNGTSY